MKTIFDIKNETIVASSKKLHLIITLEGDNIFHLYIIDLKYMLNELDISISPTSCNLPEANTFAENWLAEIENDFYHAEKV